MLFTYNRQCLLIIPIGLINNVDRLYGHVEFFYMFSDHEISKLDFSKNTALLRTRYLIIFYNYIREVYKQ